MIMYKLKSKLPNKVLAELVRLKFEIKLRLDIPIFVYQMGKVGSTSVHNSLLKYYRGKVFHAHDFSLNHRENQIGRLYNWAVIRKKPIYIISLTREPISRNISAFFQDYEKYTGTPFNDSKLNIPELRNIFFNKFNHNQPLDWFDNNIFYHFGIDVYETKFQEENSFIIKKDNVKLLVLRSETKDDKKELYIKEFLGLKKFIISNKNISEDKIYSNMYYKFLNQIKFPEDYLKRMIDSKYFKHFYGREFQEQAVLRWEEK